MYADTLSSSSLMNSHASQKHVQDQQILEQMKDALKVVVEWRAPAVSLDRKRSSVRDTLRSFCLHLERLMDYEEEGGYLESLADSKPNWSDRISRLREEHEDLRQRINRLVPQVSETVSWSVETFNHTCTEISELLERVDSHDREEITLLQETLLNDEGGEG